MTLRPVPVRPLDIELAATPGNVLRARHAVASYSADQAVDHEAVAIAVSEAVTNAVMHAYRDASRERSALRVPSEGALLVIVSDDGPGMTPAATARDLRSRLVVGERHQRLVGVVIDQRLEPGGERTPVPRIDPEDGDERAAVTEGHSLLVVRADPRDCPPPGNRNRRDAAAGGHGPPVIDFQATHPAPWHGAAVVPRTGAEAP